MILTSFTYALTIENDHRKYILFKSTSLGEKLINKYDNEGFLRVRTLGCSNVVFMQTNNRTSLPLICKI